MRPLKMKRLAVLAATGAMLAGGAAIGTAGTAVASVPASAPASLGQLHSDRGGGHHDGYRHGQWRSDRQYYGYHDGYGYGYSHHRWHDGWWGDGCWHSGYWY
ncbi:hypothetical protein AB0D30_40420 [Streptomyces sp. NPDC048409]|uniref:hypothetical protein n=1 Tax=Streptomyces sp. NPDC048409 TaxID=3154723 RepID=UPI003417B0E1